MSEFEQVPFNAYEFFDNPEPRCPCLLLLDNSYSMKGAPLDELNRALVAFKDELAADSMARKRVELALVSYGPVKVVTDFKTPDMVEYPVLEAEGDTPMGAAIETGLDLLRRRKDSYKANGISYYRPLVFLFTDGGPTDNWSRAAQLVRDGSEAKAFSFHAIGVQGANMDILSQISVHKQPLQLQGVKFREFFQWLSNSLSGVSRSQPSEEFRPPYPSGWAVL